MHPSYLKNEIEVQQAVKDRNPTILRQNASIGNLTAETDDDFLFDCFFYHPLVDSLSDMSSRGMVLLGRTGSGKTAMLRHIEITEENVRKVDLFEMAMEYVSNSDVIRFLSALGIDLDLFFQALWKHVLCLEYIRAKYSLSDETKSRNLFDRISEMFGKDERRKRAISYLKEWQGKFWITSDENIKELTQKLESSVNAELGMEIDKFKARAGYERTLSTEKRSEIIARAKKFVSATQLTDLSQVLDLLGEYDDEKSKKIFILVDRIDEKWVDDTLRFKLVRALVESLKGFRKIKNLKIVVAMRADVYERIIVENQDVGFQREKYEDYSVTIDWSKSQLAELIEKRIRYLYRKKYTKGDVKFSDLFAPKIGPQESIDYLLTRTFYRPRDILSFVNECLLHSVGKTEISAKDVKEAEATYSRKRLQALFDEWRSVYPTLELCTRLFEKNKETCEIRDISARELISDVILQIASDEKYSVDPLYKVSLTHVNSTGSRELFEIAYTIVSQCYRVGLVGVKLAPDVKYEFAYKDSPFLTNNQFSPETRVQVHRMLHRALNVGING